MDVPFTPGLRVAYLPQYLLDSRPEGVAAVILADTGRNRYGDRTCTLRLLEDAPAVAIPDREGIKGLSFPVVSAGAEFPAYDRQVRPCPQTAMEARGYRFFRSMGGLYAAPPGVATTDNTSGKGWIRTKPDETLTQFAARLLRAAEAQDDTVIALSIPARQAIVEMTDSFGNGYVIMPSPRGGWTLCSTGGTPNSFSNLFDRGAVVEALLEQCQTAKDVLDLITAHARRYTSGPKAGEFTSRFPPRLVTA